MKQSLYIVILLFSNLFFGQNFKLFYTEIGLGSNHGYPAYAEVSISGENMFLRSYHKISDTTLRELQDPDTIGDFSIPVYQYKFDFRTKDIETICQFVDTLKNKKVICSNPNVRSGAIYKLFVKNGEFFTEFAMANTFDSTAQKIIIILNSYLPEGNQIYIPLELWQSNSYKEPLIKPFVQPGEGNYREVYENEYEILIRK